MKLRGKQLNKRRKMQKQAIAAANNPDKDFINESPHDGNLAQAKEREDQPRRNVPCTALTTPIPTDLTQNEGSTDLVPTDESPAQVVKKRRMKFNGNHLPVVHCNTCQFTQTCPQYKPGYQCAFIHSMMKKIESAEDIPEFMQLIVEADMGRLQQALVFEQLNGGGSSEEVTLLMDSVFNKLQRMHDLKSGKPPESEGGLLAKLFGSMLSGGGGDTKPTIRVEKVIEVEDPNDYEGKEQTEEPLRSGPPPKEKPPEPVEEATVEVSDHADPTTLP